jgi:tripartite-type tricarboxylate transporter receptor subunit TctC
MLALALCGLVLWACVDKGSEEAKSKEEIEKMAARFPAREIRLICPPRQGGLSDFITRTLGVYTEKHMGADIIVENRPGASGATGMRFGAKSRPDGYTVTYVTVESTILKHRKDIDETVSYADFELLARLNYGPAALSVKADSSWKTFADFVAHAKSHPARVTVGNSGQYSIWHLAAAVMADKTGIRLVYVPYDGAAPSIQDLLGGHLDAVVSSPSEVFTFVKSGQLRLLAIFGEQRNLEFPQVPTARELGNDIIVGAWGGLGVPKGTPAAIRRILYQKFKAGFDTAEFRQKCKERSVQLGWQGTGTFSGFARQQDQMFARILGTLSMK